MRRVQLLGEAHRMFQVRDEQHRMIESNGDTLPQLKEIFSDQPIYRRTGIINCCEDPSFRSALEDLLANIGRTHVIISRVTIGTCCSMPTLAMRHDGYPVFPVIDACVRGTPMKQMPQHRAWRGRGPSW
jgi:hypothetical protein